MHFIGLKGEKLRDKVTSMGKNVVYEVRANLADHPKAGDEF